MSVDRAELNPENPEKPSMLARSIAGFAVAAWALCFPLYAWKIWLKTDYTDFAVYYRAAARAQNGLWSQTYSLADGASPFRYAPLTLPLFRPLAALSYPVAKLVWFGLQYLWFGLGFLLLYRALKFARVRYPFAITAAASLFVLRFCLDCFTIGQVSSLLFLCFAASFAAWSFRRPGIASATLAIPAVFKIGPGILFALFLKGRSREKWRAITAPIALLAAWSLVLLAWLFTALRGQADSVLGVWASLWSDWSNAVSKDSQYFDAAHYGSQSVKSFYLRLAASGTITPAFASALYAGTALAICAGTLAFWLCRKPRGVRGRAFFFASGIFPYLWVMPETFKYTLTALAIPVALLLAEVTNGAQKDPEKRDRLTVFALIFGTLTLSLAGKDIVGDTLFFGLQKASIPLLATVFLGWATFRHAFRNSLPSHFTVNSKQLLGDLRPGPWEEAAPPASTDATLIVAIPLFAGRELDFPLIGKLLERTHELLPTLEVRLEPYGDRVSRFHPAWIYLSELSARRNWKFAQSGEIQAVRSLALRHSFLRSSGRKILILQAEQPCEPTFFAEALRALERNSSEDSAGDLDIGLVRGNRRLAESRFRIPVKLLRLVYRRHRLGLRFNQIVRALLPVSTTDTHSGLLALDRKLAAEAFALQSSKDFLFDLELSLVARTHGFREIELPVTLYLATEKRPARMAWETISILLGLPRLALRFRRGFYNPPAPNLLQHHFTADDWGISPEVNRGILELARRGVVRRVSMMAKTRYLKEGLNELRNVPGVELGIHFDLTFERERPRDLFFRWMLAGARRAGREVMARDVRAELDRQLKTLEAVGVSPVYLDGHHHIHLIPGIIDAIAERCHQAGIRRMRLPYDPALWWTKLAALNVLSLGARSTLRKRGFDTLPCFYPRPEHFMDPGRFRASLALRAGAEVIVHPARANDFAACGIVDPYSEQRVREYRALRMLRPGPESNPP
jgi:chitin disaccharide deacetylase